MGSAESSTALNRSSIREEDIATGQFKCLERNCIAQASENNAPKIKREFPFHATWTQLYPETMTPEPRTGHWSVSDGQFAYIGYGMSATGILLNDVWMMDLGNLSWKCLIKSTGNVKPRHCSTAVLIDENIYIFGGRTAIGYVTDFHLINIVSKKIIGIESPGAIPDGRIGHAFGTNGTQIALWGGFSGTILNDFWIFDLIDNSWTNIESSIGGRLETAFCTIDDIMYIAAASTTDSIIIIDFKDHSISEIDVGGNSPPFELYGAMMVPVNEFLFLFGGRKQSQKFSNLRAFDTIRRSWMIIPLTPDGVSVAMSDGSVDQNGFFLIPRKFGSTFIYNKENRSFISILGNPTLDPPPFTILSIVDALEYLHLTKDMLDVIKM